jgi:hypothetical protein
MVASGPTRPASTRISIARLAARVIAASPALVATSGDGRWVTVDGGDRIPGVVAAEAGGGRVDVALHLVASWPPQPLEALAGQLREALLRSAASAGLGGRLGRVDVSIHDLQLPEAEGRPR